MDSKNCLYYCLMQNQMVENTYSSFMAEISQGLFREKVGINQEEQKSDLSREQLDCGSSLPNFNSPFATTLAVTTSKPKSVSVSSCAKLKADDAFPTLNKPSIREV
ncbi:hypothetical protein V2J09_010131 [Rumex salicifolius]